VTGAATGLAATLAELAPRYGRAWLVGGAVRDSLLGRETPTSTSRLTVTQARWRARSAARQAGTRSSCQASSAPGVCAHTSRTGRSI